jgi:predicted component of type VI protein secretion system
MPLKLRVISDHYKVLGPRRSQLFGVTGGRIGRSPDNDWVLPDSQHFVSGHHAKVIFRAGAWLLEDTSRNGVYLNESDAPLSESGPATLNDGDRLRIGEYEVLVTIDDHTDFAADVSGQMPIPSALRAPAAARESRAQAVARRTRKKEEPRRPPANHQVSLDEFLKPDLEVTDVLVRSRQKQSQSDRLSNSASIQLHADGLAGMGEGLADFCRGLGIDPKSMPARSQSALLTAAGQLLRETTVQLTRMLKQQAERAGMDQAGAADGRSNNPLLSSPSFDSTIYRMFASSRSDISTGAEVLRDAFDQVRDYQGAFDAALATALDELLSRINPTRIAARSDQSSAVSLFGGSKREKYWELFSEVFAALDQRDERGWPTILAREFAKALAAQLRSR